jgi:hypothetical protein
VGRNSSIQASVAPKYTGNGMEKDLCKAIIILIELQMGYISSALMIYRLHMQSQLGGKLNKIKRLIDLKSEISSAIKALP